MGIMLIQNLIGKLHHLHASNSKTFLFETADYVKFAKAFASDEENAVALPSAVRFVTTTYQSQLAEEEAKAAASAGDNAKGGEK